MCEWKKYESENEIEIERNRNEIVVAATAWQ